MISTLTAKVEVRKRVWFWPAFWLAHVALAAGVDVERCADLLARYCLRLDIQWPR